MRNGDYIFTISRCPVRRAGESITRMQRRRHHMTARMFLLFCSLTRSFTYNISSPPPRIVPLIVLYLCRFISWHGFLKVGLCYGKAIAKRWRSSHLPSDTPIYRRRTSRDDHEWQTDRQTWSVTVSTMSCVSHLSWVERTDSALDISGEVSSGGLWPRGRSSWTPGTCCEVSRWPVVVKSALRRQSTTWVGWMWELWGATGRVRVTNVSLCVARIGLVKPPRQTERQVVMLGCASSTVLFNYCATDVNKLQATCMQDGYKHVLLRKCRFSKT